MQQRIHSFILRVLLFGVLLVCATDCYGRVYGSGSQPQPFIIKGRAVLHLKPGVNPVSARSATGTVVFGQKGLDLVSSTLGVNSIRKVFPWRHETAPTQFSGSDLSRFFEISFPDSLDVHEVVNDLIADQAVRHAEPVWAMPMYAMTPNDPESHRQWYIDTIWLSSGWEVETGSDSVKVAVIDGGVNYRHPELTNHIWVNPGEDVDNDMVVYDFEDLNGIDDDSNGVVDDLIGYDFFSGLNAGVIAGEDDGTPDSDPNDFNGHGTHISGIITGTTNNEEGIAGIAGGWQDDNPASNTGVKVICLRAGGTAPDGLGYVNSVNCATCIDYAVMVGADIINCSWGGNSVQYAAVENALAQGIMVVHAAGNDSDDEGDVLDMSFMGNCVSVASTRVDDKRSWFSNYGSWIDVCAPGDDIYSTVSLGYEEGYVQWDGTSFAAPMVSGLAALIWSMKPSMTMTEVRDAIVYTADDIDDINPGYEGLLGSGRINVLAALSTLPNAKFSANVTSGEVPLTVSFTDESPNSPTSWTWSFGDGESSFMRSPIHVYDEPGIYSVSLVIDEPRGMGEEHLRNLIWVRADTLRFESVDGYAGSQTVVPIYFRNTALVKKIMISFTMENDAGVTIANLSIEGLRTEQYFKRQMTGYGGLKREYTLKPKVTGGSTYLPPGSGPVANLVVNIPDDAEEGAIISIDSLTWVAGYNNISTLWGDFVPEIQAGEIIVKPCCGRFTNGFTGNANCSEDGKITLSDITMMIDRVYVAKADLCCEMAGNANGSEDGIINLSDITRAIDHVFVSREPLAPCF